MRKIPAMVDMRRTPAEKEESAVQTLPGNGPDYPWGLAISLDQDSLDKLGLDDDVGIGDMIHLHAMAKVTSVSKTDNEATGPCCRIELQITHIATEDEDTEDDDEDDKPTRRSRLYGA